MPRPRKRRFLSGKPKGEYFKPRGIPLLGLEEVVLASDEVEALKLRYVRDLKQMEAAEKMKISQSTFQRILETANKKIALAIIKGKAIKIEWSE